MNIGLTLLNSVRIRFAIIAIVGALHAPNMLWGQATWTSTSATIYTPAGTNVGIGGAPLLNFDVIGGSGQSNLFRVRSDYSNPTFVFQNDYNTSYGGGTIAFKTSQGTFASPVVMSNGALLGQMIFYGHDGTNYNTISSMIRAGVDGNVAPGVVPGNIQFWTAPLTGSGGIREAMRINANGYVGIGTVNPQNMLSVNGVVQAKEVVVNTGWSDYVFASNYRLKPLKEVAAYISKNHHLPEIPTEAEVLQNGVNLGEMQSKLLAKVEELTLHMIRADEQNTELQKQDRELRARIARLESASPVGASGHGK